MPTPRAVSNIRKQAVQTRGAPTGLPFSSGIKLGSFLFISGQGPFDGKGNLVGGDIRSQTRTTLENFKKVVDEAGSDMDNVLQTTVYMKDLQDYSGMNEVYSSFFSEPRPARATVGVGDLLFGMRVEIQGIAYISKQKRPSR